MQLIKPHVRSIGAFDVHRLLPAFPQKTIGPFIFFDHMGPADLPPGQGMDVRPHPHIGLATVTYLFDGAGLHRDSLGSKQRIVPGDVNWMTAGRGIVHSERTAPEDLATGVRLHGLQIWIALPKAFEEAEPSFSHHPSSTIPRVTLPGATLRVILGTAYGATSPVETYSDTVYVAAELEAGAALPFSAEHAERGVYVVEGNVRLNGNPVPPRHMVFLSGEGEVLIEAEEPSKVALIGGEPLDGERFIWWNFVASSREKIEEAKARWREQQFGKVPEETEWIPLPE
ncbi:pirin family protein [Noviherbaspirillum galbum]|nr:pirin family protein [Noviherbaspirillum galbum]